MMDAVAYLAETGGPLGVLAFLLYRMTSELGEIKGMLSCYLRGAKRWKTSG